MVEGQILLDPIDIGWVHHGSFAQAAKPLCVLGLSKMAAACAGAQYLACAGDLEPFEHGFLRFIPFGTTHNLNWFAKDVENNLFPQAWQAGNPKIRDGSLRWCCSRWCSQTWHWRSNPRQAQPPAPPHSTRKERKQ